MSPFLGRNFQAMDPLEWLARLSDGALDAASLGSDNEGLVGDRPFRPGVPTVECE
jgi:hypothetical protein